MNNQKNQHSNSISSISQNDDMEDSSQSTIEDHDSTNINKCKTSKSKSSRQHYDKDPLAYGFVEYNDVWYCLLCGSQKIFNLQSYSRPSKRFSHFVHVHKRSTLNQQELFSLKTKFDKEVHLSSIDSTVPSLSGHNFSSQRLNILAEYIVTNAGYPHSAINDILKPFLDSIIYEYNLNSIFQYSSNYLFNPSTPSFVVKNLTKTDTVCIKDINACTYFSLQIEETCEHATNSLLIVYIRYDVCYTNTQILIKDHFLFSKSLTKEVTTESVFECLDNYLRSHKINWNKCIHVCMDISSSLIGKQTNFSKLIQNKNSNISVSYCITHRFHYFLNNTSEDLATYIAIFSNVLKEYTKIESTVDRILSLSSNMTLSMFKDYPLRWFTKGYNSSGFFQHRTSLSFCLFQLHSVMYSFTQCFFYDYILAYLTDLFHILNTSYTIPTSSSTSYTSYSTFSTPTNESNNNVDEINNENMNPIVDKINNENTNPIVDNDYNKNNMNYNTNNNEINHDICIFEYYMHIQSIITNLKQLLISIQNQDLSVFPSIDSLINVSSSDYKSNVFSTNKVVNKSNIPTTETDIVTKQKGNKRSMQFDLESNQLSKLSDYTFISTEQAVSKDTHSISNTMNSIASYPSSSSTYNKRSVPYLIELTPSFIIQKNHFYSLEPLSLLDICMNHIIYTPSTYIDYNLFEKNVQDYLCTTYTSALSHDNSNDISMNSLFIKHLCTLIKTHLNNIIQKLESDFLITDIDCYRYLIYPNEYKPLIIPNCTNQPNIEIVQYQYTCLLHSVSYNEWKKFHNTFSSTSLNSFLLLIKHNGYDSLYAHALRGVVSSGTSEICEYNLLTKPFQTSKRISKTKSKQ